MNAKKRLLLGNHDELDVGVYWKYFQKALLWRQFGYKTAGGDLDCALLCTHVPVYPDNLLFRYRGRCLNVHGHMHDKVVMRNGVPDTRYCNIACEFTNYTPVPHEWLLAKARHLPLVDA